MPWPDELALQYARAGWWRGRDLGAEFADVAAARADATALVDGTTRISYGSLLARADALASRLARLGLRPGTRIVVQLPNGWPFVVLTLACLRAGIVPVMALPAHRRHELAYLCEHSEARALAVPDVLRGFDHQQMAEELLASSATLAHILVAGQDVRHQDLAALCSEPLGSEPEAPVPAPDPPDPAWRRGVPALRRHHRAAQADRPHPQRLLLQRARLRGAVPPGRAHGLPRLAARLAQLPAGLPRHPRHPAVRRPGGHDRVTGPGQRVRRHRAGGRHDHRGRARGGPALAGPRRRVRLRRLAHAPSPAGRRRPPRRRARHAGQAGARRDPAAGVRHGRGAAELHQAGRPGRGRSAAPRAGR